MKDEKIIGIVAGVGPYAGLDLMRKILAETVARTDQDHLAVAALSQPRAIADRTAYLLGQTRENPGYALARQLQTLAGMGAQVAGIPCNTAHAPAIFNVVRSELDRGNSKLKLLHLIEEVARFLTERHPRVKRVGILSTTGTLRARVYPDILAPLGFEPLVPPLSLQQQRIHPAIYDPVYGIKAGGGSEKARQELLAGVRSLQEQGAEAVILGCTEIPLAIAEPVIGDTVMIDPARVLARALIREANPSKLKPL